MLRLEEMLYRIIAQAVDLNACSLQRLTHGKLQFLVCAKHSTFRLGFTLGYPMNAVDSFSAAPLTNSVSTQRRIFESTG